MPQNGIIYNLLIAGPPDTKEYFKHIIHAIERFNIHDEKKRITIVGERLEDRIFAESGGRPYDLVRSQIMQKYDMMVLVFWKDYSSFLDTYYVDAAELIKWLSESGKQIFTYFIDKAVAISEQKHNEKKMLQELRDKYLEKTGIFIMVHNEQEVEDRFYGDLQKYFEDLKNSQNENIVQIESVKEDILFAQKGNYYLPYGCIGRENTIRDFERVVAENSGPIVIKGVAGVGKTAFCSFYYQRKNQGNEQFSMLFVNLENCVSKADFIHAVCGALGLKEAFIELNTVLNQICSDNKRYDAFYFDNWEDFQCATLDSSDWHCVYRFINALAGNGYLVLISSQEKAPSRWREFHIDVLDPEDGEILFEELLKRRGKYIKNISKREEKAFRTLLDRMENHPLTMVLTASLIEDPNDTLERIENKWSEVCDRSAAKRQQSLEISLKMSYDTISLTPGAVILWGMISELNIDFPIYFVDALKQLYPQVGWDEARTVLSNRSLIQFSENMLGIHMLMPVKVQWEHFVGKKAVGKSFRTWARLIEFVAQQSEVSENKKDPELRNEIRGVMLDCMRSFMLLTSRLVREKKLHYAEKCVNAMRDYYEDLSDSAFEFLKSLPLEKFSVVTKGMILKCKGDIGRLGRKETPFIVEDYYKKALDCFQECGKERECAQVMNVIGKNQYWNFHNVDNALEWLDKSEALSQKASYIRGIAEAKKDRAILLTEEYGEYDKALKCLNEAYDLFQGLNDYQGIAHVLKRQGAIMRRQANLNGAIKKYEEALKYYKCARYIQGQGDTLSRMCILYMELGEESKLNKAIQSGDRLMDKIPYQMTKNDLLDSIRKSRDWLQRREM
ncbi:MAG: hypothetical protein KH186_00215 [Lachnospiraceae bacterium]|nr:hypothetical protein [Lachnospiraceae bacterium]